MTRGTLVERQARSEEQIKALVGAVATLVEQGKDAAESRKLGYEAAEATRIEILKLNHRMDGFEKSLDAIRPTTVELERVRDRVMFAGAFGRAVWSVGKVLVAAAAGAASAWYSMTGRLPP